MYHVSSQKREQNYKGLRRKFKVQNVDIELCSFIWFFVDYFSYLRQWKVKWRQNYYSFFLTHNISWLNFSLKNWNRKLEEKKLEKLKKIPASITSSFNFSMLSLSIHSFMQAWGFRNFILFYWMKCNSIIYLTHISLTMLKGSLPSNFLVLLYHIFILYIIIF